MTGYPGVILDQTSKSKPYQAHAWRGGKMLHLGSFATAEEAALCVARSPEVEHRTHARSPEGSHARRRAKAAPAPLTSAQALQQAKAWGVTLRVFNNPAGYYGVHLDRPGNPKPYQAYVRRGGKTVTLGTFATAEEAALCIARSPEGQAAAARAAAAPVPLTSEEARQQAQAEGLTLRVAGNTTGYYGVHLNTSSSTKPYKAQEVTCIEPGLTYKAVALGSFAIAEEAALCVARSAAGAKATAALPPPTSEVEVKDEPVQSGATLNEEVPPMPPGAFVKEEEEDVIPSMPPGARWGAKVEAPMPMPSDATAKQEHDARPTKRNRE